MDVSIINKSLENIGNINDLGLAIVIPTLNEAKGIEFVLDEISELFSTWEKIDVVVVDGHSEDGTDFIARNKGAKVVYQRDKGYGNALRTGFRYVKKNFDSKIIVMMDADSTYDAGDIPALVEPILRDEADLVLGNRFASMQKGSMSLINGLGNRLISWFARRALRIGVHDTQSGFRAFRSDLVDG
ncbi:MAG: glycosyltransferase family 2 protein, partial [Candidatus Bathyarchaeota archaeon]|nr:glycosyltransferase family 2 protein [Candidatus Bathyarchaeota archaeon]